MRVETTPPEITEEIIDFCKGISTESLKYVVVHPAPGMLPMHCFDNVSDIVEQAGGKQVNGWAIWQFANIYLYAEAHSVWMNDVGTLIDPTPHVQGESSILFLPDSKVVFNGQKIMGKRRALTASPLAEEYLKLLSEIENFLVNEFDGTKLQPDNPNYGQLLYARTRCKELSDVFKSKAERNAPCPCGSGLKYKKCCGRFEI